MVAHRIFSGIQPTGIPHLGNYLGAIRHWATQVPSSSSTLDQNSNSNSARLFCIVDLHALTQPYDRHQLQNNIYDMTAAVLGAGVRPDDDQNCLLFQQSAVVQHTELAWLLNCIVSLGQLKRMTQFKDKSANEKDHCLGLFAYPVLMAADILLYRATEVPVGEDQRQHLELARTLVTSFHHQFQCQIFPEPRAMANVENQAGRRIMSLRNPTLKMSKSERSERSKILLTDRPDEMQRKIRKAQTDSIPGLTFDPTARPGVSNLFSMYSALSDRSLDELVCDYQAKNATTSVLKQDLIDLLITRICPMGDEIRRYQKDRAYLDSVLNRGKDQASEMAAETMAQVKQAMGIPYDARCRT